MQPLEKSGTSVTQHCISVCLSKRHTSDSFSIVLKTLAKPLTVSLNKKVKIRNAMRVGLIFAVTSAR